LRVRVETNKINGGWNEYISERQVAIKSVIPLKIEVSKERGGESSSMIVLDIFDEFQELFV